MDGSVTVAAWDRAPLARAPLTTCVIVVIAMASAVAVADLGGNPLRLQAAG